MVTIYYELVKVLVENSDAEQNYLYTNMWCRFMGDNVGKLFDKKRKTKNEWQRHHQRMGLYSSYDSTDRDGGGD